MEKPNVPKRRGRPLGSRNRVPRAVAPSSLGRLPDPVVPAGLTFLPTSLTELSRNVVRVILVRNSAFSTPPEEREVGWPEGWRIPQQGDFVHLSVDWGSSVRYVDFDLGRGAIVIYLN